MVTTTNSFPEKLTAAIAKIAPTKSDQERLRALLSKLKEPKIRVPFVDVMKSLVYLLDPLTNVGMEEARYLQSLKDALVQNEIGLEEAAAILIALSEELTPGLKKAMAAAGAARYCPNCGMHIVRYPGRYPRACPLCGSPLIDKPSESGVSGSNEAPSSQKAASPVGKAINAEVSLNKERYALCENEKCRTLVPIPSGKYPQFCYMCGSRLRPLTKSNLGEVLKSAVQIAAALNEDSDLVIKSASFLLGEKVPTEGVSELRSLLKDGAESLEVEISCPLKLAAVVCKNPSLREPMRARIEEEIPVVLRDLEVIREWVRGLKNENSEFLLRMVDLSYLLALEALLEPRTLATLREETRKKSKLYGALMSLFDEDCSDLTVLKACISALTRVLIEMEESEDKGLAFLKNIMIKLIMEANQGDMATPCFLVREIFVGS